MERRLLCYDCGLEFDNFLCYSEHAAGKEHQQQVAAAFQTGLQLMSLCISTERSDLSFFLCHACHEKCQSDVILTHLKSTEHYFSVFAYLNPEQLYFGWFCPPSTIPGLKGKAEVEEKANGTGVLGVIDMPKKVFENIRTMPYSQTMKVLTETEKLKEVYRVHQPRKTTVQEYLQNPARTHPLLGLNFLVQYRCEDDSKQCGYLCLLCKKRVRETLTIAHIISFDHLYWYLDRVHPSSLHMKSSYTYGGNYSVLILELAQQASEINASGEVLEIELKAEDFTEVNSGSYANAQDLLKVIHKEQTQSDLLPKITPARKLVFSKVMSRSQTPALKPVRASETDLESTGDSTAVAQQGKLACLVCAPGALFFTMMDYKKHVRGFKHKMRKESLFRTELYSTRVPVPSIVVYEYMMNPHREEPIIGLNLVTACIKTDGEDSPIYLCHICQDKCRSKIINVHLASYNHYLLSMAFLDPEALHFGWIRSQSTLPDLLLQVREVEKKQGTGLLQVLDMPPTWFKRIMAVPYTAVVKELCQDEELKERIRVRKWTKLEQYRGDSNRKYPLLGLNFLVEFRWTESNKLCGYLCLLCKKAVREPVVIAHVIGSQHVFNYLDLAHPGSLGSKSLYKHYDAQRGAMMLDLATQAEKIDSSGKVQEIKLDLATYEEVDSLLFSDALKKLQEISEIQTCTALLVTPGPRLVPKESKPVLFPESKHVAPYSDPGHLAQVQSSSPKEPKQSSQKLSDNMKDEERQEPVIGIGQPEETQMSKLLASYLKNKLRKAPVIGLSSLTEYCRRKEANHLECITCSRTIPAYGVIGHVIGPTHQYKYIRSVHPELLKGWSHNPSMSSNSEKLRTLAAHVEKKEGCGQFKVVKLEDDSAEEMGPIPSSKECSVQNSAVLMPPQKSHNPVASLPPVAQKSIFLNNYDGNKKWKNLSIIGLREVMECTALNQSPFYICKTCKTMCSKKSIIHHVSGIGHRAKYLKANYPTWLRKVSKKLHQNHAYILKLTVIVENMEGIGDVQIVRMEQTLYKTIFKMSPQRALKHLQVIKKKQGQSNNPTGQEGILHVKHSPSTSHPHPTPKRAPCSLKTHDETVKQEDVPSQKQSKEPIMDLEGTEPVQGMKAHAIVTRSKAKQKLSKDPNLQETILPGITNEDKKESMQVQVPVAINNSSMNPGPPGQPAPLSKETAQKQVAIKQEPVEISEVLQCRGYTIAQTEGAVQITGSSEKPHQASDDQELPLEVKPQGMVARSEPPQKHSKDPNLRETILPRITNEEKKEGVQDQIPVPINNNSSMIPGPPGRPASLTKETELKQVTIKQEPAEISEDLQCPGYAIADTEDAVQITRPFEKPHQTSDNQELLLEVKPQGMAAKSEASKKHFQDLERQETELPDRTCKENAMSSLVQVRVKQEPMEHLEVWQNPECSADHAVEIPVPSEKPLQTSKHEELQQASCEKVCWQVMPRIPPQDPRRAVSSRAEIPVGESHFSKFMLSLVTHEPVPLVGLGAVVECRSFKQPTFYLCLTCAEKVSKNQIRNHIMSDCHQYKYLLLRYPDLVLDWKKNPTAVAWWLQDHERVLDVQVMKLDLSMYNKVASVPCAAALDVLQLSGKEQSRSRTRPSVSPGLTPIIVNNWTPLPREIPETPPLHPGKNDSPRDQWRPGESFPIEEAIPHQEAVLIAEPIQTAQTALDPEQDPNPSESVCLSEKESQIPAVPVEQSPDLKEADRLGVDSAVEMAKHGGAPKGPEPQNSGQSEATKAETVPAQASPGEPLPNLKGVAMDKGEEKSCRTLMDLQTYMEDPHRTQPLVGLSALKECHSEKQTSFYLCTACCVVLKTHIIEHIIGPKHRSSYLMKRRPDLFRDWSAPQDSAKRSSYLLEVAKEVEHEELGGVEEIQKVPLDSTTFLDVKSAPFDKALNLVQTIYKKQKLGDLQIHVTPAQRPVTVKKEKVEIEESCGESIQDPQISASGMSCGVENLTNAATTSQEHQLDSWLKTPLIGLQKMIKCASVERCSPPFYLCQPCSTKLTGNLQSILNHLISVQHQYFYIKSCHPKRLEKEEAAGSLTCGLTDLVQFVAKKLEEEEGCGTFQVFTMSKKVYERLKQGNYEYCMKMLNLRNDAEEGQSFKKPAARSLGQTTQRSDCPPTVHMAHPDPLVSGSLCPAELRTQKITIVKTHLESSGALAAHHPSDPSSCPSLQSCTNLHLASSYSEHVLPRTSKPRTRTPGSTQDRSNSPFLSDTVSVTKLPPEKEDNPTQPAASSLTNDMKSSVAQDGVQGQQIASLMLSDRDSRHKLGDERPWNYENRQFTSCFTLGKQSPWVCNPKDGASNNHLPDRAPIPPGTQKPLVKGGHCSNNILISPSKTVSQQEVLPVFLDSSKLAQDQTMRFRAMQDADTNSGSERMVKKWHSKEGTNRISSSNKTHCTTCLPASDCSRSMSAEGKPQSVSILGKRRRQSSSTQSHTRNDNTRRPSSDFDPPPLKIPGLHYSDSEDPC